MPGIGIGVGLQFARPSGQSLAARVAALFGPGDVGAYLDPADITTLFQDDAGATPVTASGQSLGRINGVAGKGASATQATSLKRPTYTASGGLAWLEFDGVDDEMVTSVIDMSGSNTATAVVAVRKSLAPGTARPVFLNGTVGTSSGAIAIYAPHTGSRQYAWSLRPLIGGSQTFLTEDGAAFAAPDTAVLSGLFDAAGATATDRVKPRIDGAAISATVAAAGSAGAGLAGAAFTLGRQGSDYFADRLYFCFIINRLLSADELSLVEELAALRSGVTLA